MSLGVQSTILREDSSSSAHGWITNYSPKIQQAFEFHCAAKKSHETLIYHPCTQNNVYLK